MKAERIIHVRCVAVGLLLLVGAGCDRTGPSGALVLTKVPASATIHASTDFLDLRYPVGSRVVLRSPPFDARHEKVLSGALVAAGNPVLSSDGQRAFFVGREAVTSDWQIYETVLAGWGPRVLTSMPGGAMSPTPLPNGNLLFISPVPRTDGAKASQRPSALFLQSLRGRPQQLTFGSSPVIDSTVLSDGRILFVAMNTAPSSSSSHCALFTINNDGTEVTAFAEDKRPVSVLEQPRQISGGRVAFLVSKAGASSPDRLAEFVRLAQPRQDGSLLISNATARIWSVRPAADDDLLVCADGLSGNSTLPAVFRVNSTAPTLGSPLVADSKWSFAEAVDVSPRRPPMGRLSTLDITKHTGKILCLDVHFTQETSGEHRSTAVGTRVRVTAEISPGIVEPLGDIPVQADGSFLAEVPADTPLGFEVIDAGGRTVGRQLPLVWVRPGENRSCVGCHEPSSRAPHNRRPLAVNAPVPCLNLPGARLAKAKSDQ